MRVDAGIMVTLFASVTLAPDLRAQAIISTQMQTFMKSDFYGTLINRALTAIPPRVFRKCPTLVSNGSRVRVLKPISFGKDGFPNAGQWKQSFPVSGCGNDTILNFYFSVGADEKVNTLIAVPGATHVDISLSQDAVASANIGAGQVAKGCKAFDIKNTKFEGYGTRKPPTRDPGPKTQFRPWWETWTLTGCGHTIDVPIDFLPDAKGTRIIQLGAIKR